MHRSNFFSLFQEIYLRGLYAAKLAMKNRSLRVFALFLLFKNNTPSSRSRTKRTFLNSRYCNCETNWSLQNWSFFHYTNEKNWSDTSRKVRLVTHSEKSSCSRIRYSDRVRKELCACRSRRLWGFLSSRGVVNHPTTKGVLLFLFPLIKWSLMRLFLLIYRKLDWKEFR